VEQQLPLPPAAAAALVVEQQLLRPQVGSAGPASAVLLRGVGFWVLAGTKVVLGSTGYY
jgi:hypothetical protein